jgi:peptide/nickel transport system substrate-binding protein
VKKIVWVVACCLMALSLVIASCGTTEDTGGKVTEEGTGTTITTETETKEVKTELGTEEKIEVTKDAPEYGGTIVLSMTADPDPDLLGWFASGPQHIAHDSIWDGDWTKGLAGGYGTGQVLWEENTNVPELNVGAIAESWRWEVNEATQMVETYVTLRDNIYFAQPDSEAGRLVGGRKLTTDDVVWCIQQHITNPESDNYKGFPACRTNTVEKVGPSEIKLTIPFSLHLDSIMRYFSYVLMFPPELWDKYGYNSCTDLNLSVGTGPYMMKDYVVSNMVLMEKNPAYWNTDPIGPGKGNQLPYADKVKMIVMPDLSTQQAALRSGNIDRLAYMTKDDADYMAAQNPKLKVAQRGGGHNQPVFFRMDKAPFNDKNVRRAMQMAIDLNEINDSLYGGKATLINFPYYYTPAYAGLYLGLDDPACPASVKELFTCNPEKAKQLLKDAGYPDGFKTELVIVSEWADYYSILKEYWSKINVEVNLRTVQDFGQLISTDASLGFDGMLAMFISPCSTYPEQAQFSGEGWLNPSRINDPYVLEMAKKARSAGVTSLTNAMAITKELTAFLLDNAYAIQAPHYPNYCMWWPWLKNYSGEVSVGYMRGEVNWVTYIWVDQALKNTMGK